MTTWIDFAVYAALMTGLWFVLPRLNSRLAVPVVADRNPEWLAAHPEFVKDLSHSRWFQRSCFVLGAMSLAVLASFQAGFWPEAWSPPAHVDKWDTLKDINGALMIVGVIYWITVAGIGLIWITRNVPLSSQRHATLEPRSIDDFVPRWAMIATYSLVCVNVAAWLAVGTLKLYSTPIFWTRLALIVSLSAGFFVMTRVGVTRRPNAMDRIYGPGYRRAEVRFGFAAQLIPPIAGAVRLYEEVANTVVADINRGLHLGVALFVVIGLVRFARLPKHRGGSGGTYFSRRSISSPAQI